MLIFETGHETGRMQIQPQIKHKIEHKTSHGQHMKRYQINSLYSTGLFEETHLAECPRIP